MERLEQSLEAQRRRLFELRTSRSSASFVDDSFSAAVSMVVGAASASANDFEQLEAKEALQRLSLKEEESDGRIEFMRAALASALRLSSSTKPAQSPPLPLPPTVECCCCVDQESSPWDEVLSVAKALGESLLSSAPLLSGTPAESGDVADGDDRQKKAAEDATQLELAAVRAQVTQYANLARAVKKSQRTVRHVLEEFSRREQAVVAKCTTLSRMRSEGENNRKRPAAAAHELLIHPSTSWHGL